MWLKSFVVNFTLRVCDFAPRSFRQKTFSVTNSEAENMKNTLIAILFCIALTNFVTQPKAKQLQTLTNCRAKLKNERR